MALMNALRRRMFWYVDTLKGDPIKQHYQEITNLLEFPTSKKTNETKESNLNRLLTHAVSTTPYYKNKVIYQSLADFPIIDKNLILKNYEAFKSSVYEAEKLYQATSSGSTGIPFTILQDNIKRSRNTADAIYFLELAGGTLGEKLFYLKLWDYKNRKSWLTNRLQNIYAHNVMDSKSKDMQELIKVINKYKHGKNIIGYPSFFEEFSSYLKGLEKVPEFKNINTIISIAESIKDEEKETLGKFFNCKVFERYSNQENGILAQQTLSNPNKLSLNWASYYFEVLRVDSNEHVGNGELGRLVLTDLFNYAMPMIRYDTGDMAVWVKTESGQPYISSVFGRRMDTIFDTNGAIVSPHVFYMVLDFGEIKQYQFVQIDKNSYLFRLNGNKRKVNEDKIVTYFKKCLGEDASISFEYVDEIPLLSSGKRKKIVSKYKKS